MSENPRRSPCPIACTLDVIGDKWSMIVLRDLFLGVTRFNGFLSSPERITTSVLADRLARLEEEGLVEKAAYQEHPIRWEYRLASKGRDLAPVMRAMIDWARIHQTEVIRAPFLTEPVAALVDRLEGAERTGSAGANEEIGAPTHRVE